MEANTKAPAVAGAFNLMGDEGLEPPTSRM